MFWILARKAIVDIGDLRNKNAHARYASIWNGISPRMHQASNNRYNPNGYGSLRVTPDLRCQTGMVKTRLFIHLSFLIRPSVVINNKDLLKIRLIFNFYAHISCKNDWNNFYCWTLIGPLTVSTQWVET